MRSGTATGQFPPHLFVRMIHAAFLRALDRLQVVVVFKPAAEFWHQPGLAPKGQGVNGG